jgi:hypothetical protein
VSQPDATGADAPAPVAQLSTHAGALSRILRTAEACGWRTAALRPAGHLAGKAAGFPSLILVHGGAGRIWYVLLRQSTGALPVEAEVWAETLIRAGAVWRLVQVPDDLDQLLVDLADAVRP